MTQTMTKEQILEKVANEHSYDSWGELMYDTHEQSQIEYTCQAMSEWESQQLSAERESHKKEIERILSAVARGENLADSLNFDGKSELQKERERAGKLVSALRSISAYTEDNFIQQKANQTLNDYDTATKEPGSH